MASLSEERIAALYQDHIADIESGRMSKFRQATVSVKDLLSLIEKLRIAERALDYAYFKEITPSAAKEMAENRLVAEGQIRKEGR